MFIGISVLPNISGNIRTINKIVLEDLKNDLIKDIYSLRYFNREYIINNHLVIGNTKLVNTDNNGLGEINPIWIANQSYQEWYQSIEVYEDNIYAVGYSWDKENETYYAILGKYDINDGSQIWMKSWSTNYLATFMHSLDVYKDVIYVTGTTIADKNIYSFICKFDLNGNFSWSKIIDENSSNLAFCIKVYEDFIYICGDKDFAACLWKFNTNGEELWSKCYEIPDAAIGALLDLEIYDENIYADGMTFSWNNGQELLIVKIDLNGNLQWFTEWGGGGILGEIGYFMDIGDNGFIYIAGASAEDTEKFNDYIWKCDLNGNIKWVTTTSLKSVLFDVVFWNGNIYAIGVDRTAYKDALLVKVDDKGNLIWYLTWKSKDNDSYANGLAMYEYEDYFYLCGSNIDAGFLMKYDVTLFSENNKPNTPIKPSGPQSGKIGERYSYRSVATDPDDDLLSYQFSWGDGRYSRLYWVKSGEPEECSYYWMEEGIYSVRVRVRDEHGFVSDWSDPLEVSMPRYKVTINSILFRFLEQLQDLLRLLTWLG